MINRALLAANLALILAAMHPSKPASLTLSELNIVDAKGVVRLRLSGDLPGTVNGERRNIAGLLFYDGTGRERGSHVTDAEHRVFLSLTVRRRPPDPDHRRPLPLHRAERGGGRIVWHLWWSRLPQLQGRLARDPGLGDGPSAGAPQRRHRSGALFWLRLRGGAGAARHAQVQNRRPPSVPRRRRPFPEAVLVPGRWRC